MFLDDRRMKKKVGDRRPRTVLNTNESLSFNYAQGKTDTETNFVVNNEICLGVRFAFKFSSVTLLIGRLGQLGRVQKDKLHGLAVETKKKKN